MHTERLPTELQVLDALASQAILNERIGSVLQSLHETQRDEESEVDELREDIGRLATEVAHVNQRMESLTATVGRLMAAVESPETELHSVKVPDAGA